MLHFLAIRCEHISVHYSHKCSRKNSSLDTCIKLSYVYFMKKKIHPLFAISIIRNMSFATRLTFSRKPHFFY